MEIIVTLSKDNLKSIAKEVVMLQKKEITEKISKEKEKKLNLLKAKLSEKTQYTVNEVSEMSKRSGYTIRRHININLLTASKVGKSWLISQEDYQKYINNEQ